MASAVAGAVAGTAMIPAAAGAHGLSGLVQSPLPLAAYLGGAAVAVAVSFILIAVGDPRPPRAIGEGAERTVPRPLRLAMRAAGLAAWAWVVAQTIAGGSSDADVASILLWSWGWVGLAIVCALIGPVWQWIDPFTTLHDLGAWVLRRTGVRGIEPAPLPASLGSWPAVAGFAVIVWFELVARVSSGRLLGLVLIGYTAVTLVGMAQYGRDTWRERGETFTVWFGVLGRMARWAPVAATDGRRVRRQGMVEGLVGAAWPREIVVLVALGVGAIIFDGLSQTRSYFDLFGMPGPLVSTVILAGGMVVLLLAVLGVARRTGLAAMGAGLLPVALGYLIAHYLPSLLLESQRIVIAVSDPFQQGWDLFGTAFYQPGLDGIPVGLFWTIQVGAVVIGHVAGAWAGHVAARAHGGAGTGSPRTAQVALAILMVALTTITLWSLGQALVFDVTAGSAVLPGPGRGL